MPLLRRFGVVFRLSAYSRSACLFRLLNLLCRGKSQHSSINRSSADGLRQDSVSALGLFASVESLFAAMVWREWQVGSDVEARSAAAQAAAITSG
jgi:hypothetical protein